MVELKLVDPSNDLACEAGLSTWKRGHVLAGESFSDSEFLSKCFWP